MTVAFLLRNRGQIINHGDVNQYAQALAGVTAQQMLWNQWSDGSNYAAVIGNQDTTNGLALKVQYGTSGAPTSIATFTKDAMTSVADFHVSGSQALFFEAAGTNPDENTLFQLVKTLTRPGHILLDSTAYVTAVNAASNTGTASGGADDSPGPPTLIDSGIGWTVNAYANHAVRVTGGTGQGQWGLIASNTADTLTLYAGTVWPLATDATSTYAIYSKSGVDPSNVKVNTYVQDTAFADVRGLELHVESSAQRGEGTQWGIELGVHPGIATTDGTDKIVGYVARVTPPSATVGTRPAAAVNGDVAFLAYGGAVAGVTGSAGWRRYIRFRDSSDNISFEVLGDGQVNLPKLSSATEPSTGLTGLYTLSANSRLYRFPNGGSQTLIADQVTSFTYLDQKAGDGASGVLSFTSIPQTYRSLYIEIVGRGTSAATNVAVRVTLEGSPTAGAYNHQYATAINTTLAGAENTGTNAYVIVGTVPAASSDAGAHGHIKLDIPEYTNANVHKGILFQGIAPNDTGIATGDLTSIVGGGYIELTAAVSRIDITIASGNWATTTRATLWGRPAS